MKLPKIGALLLGVMLILQGAMPLLLPHRAFQPWEKLFP